MGKAAEDDVSLHDELAAAFAESGKGDGDLDESIDALEPKQERDEHGKFKAKEEPGKKEEDADDEPIVDKDKEVDKDVVTDLEPAKEPLLKEDRAPTGWNPKVREQWASLPAEVRQEVIRREEASALGVRQLQEQFKPANDFVQSLSPFIQEAINSNVHPAQYIGNVMQAERSLRQGNDEDRLGALLDIGESYGINLRAILKEAMGYDVLPAKRQSSQQQMQIPPEIQQELAEARRFREQHTQTEEQRVQAEIQTFAKDKPYFHDVQDDMALLLERGRASSLEDAYDKACRMNPDVWDLIQAKNGTKTDAQKLAERQKAASGVKTKSSSTEVIANQDDDDDDLATTIRKTVAQSGRI